MRTSLLLFGASVVLGAGSLVWAGETGASGVRAGPEQIWSSSCGYCHGGPMNAPVLHGRRLPEQLILTIVRNGTNGMPPFHQSEISDAELQALARWVGESKAAPAGDRP